MMLLLLGTRTKNRGNLFPPTHFLLSSFRGSFLKKEPSSFSYTPNVCCCTRSPSSNREKRANSASETWMVLGSFFFSRNI